MFKIVIGSWMYDKHALNFVEEFSRVYATNCIQNSLWELSHVSVEKIYSMDRYYDISGDTQSVDVSINILLKRKPLYFIINNIFPCFILNCVTLLAFSLPFAVQIGLSKQTENYEYKFISVLKFSIKIIFI